MLPDWESMQQSWPLMVAVAAIWARIEMAISRTTAQSVANAAELAKLETKVDSQGKDANVSSIQLATLAANSITMGGQLNRIEDKLDSLGKK